MCKRKLGIFLVIASCVCLTKGVDAACDYETQNRLKSEAANIRAVYEVEHIGTGEFEPLEVPDDEGNTEFELTEDRIKINLYNLTESLYAVITNKFTNEIETVHYKDTNSGSMEWYRTDLSNIEEYEIKIYTEENECKNEELRTIALTTPKVNIYHYSYVCADVDEYFCDEYITKEINMTEEEILRRTDQARKEKIIIEEEKKEEKTFWGEYKIYILIAIGMVVIGGLTIILVKKKQRSDVL